MQFANNTEESTPDVVVVHVQADGTIDPSVDVDDTKNIIEK